MASRNGGPRADKAAAVALVRERIQSSSATILTEYRGLTVAELARLRAQLRPIRAEYKVVKNTLTRIAARDAGMDVPDATLTGPTAVLFTGEDPVAAAKVLRSFSRENPELVVKGSILDGRFLDAADTMRLADLESREELLARLAGMMEAVIAQPARLAAASLSKAARLFQALIDKRSAEGDAPAAAPVPAEIS
jgi:large subunit ribosomal protein L10